MKKDRASWQVHKGKAWDRVVGSGSSPPPGSPPEEETPGPDGTKPADEDRQEGVDSLATLGDVLLAKVTQELRTEVGRLQSQLQLDLAGVRDQLLEQQRFQPTEVADVVQAVRAEMAALRAAVARLIEAPREVGVPPGLTEALAQLTEEQRRQQAQLAEQLAAEQRNQQARHDEALQAVLTRLAEAFQAHSDEIAEERRQQQAQLAEAIQALRAQMAGVPALVERPVEVAEQVPGLPAELTAATQQLVLRQREQEARHEQALQEIEGRVQSRLIDQGRDLRAQLSEFSEALPAEVAHVREAAAALGRQLVEERRQQAGQLADLAESLRAEVAHARRAVERPVDLPEPVAALPGAMRDLEGRFLAGQRAQMSEMAGALRTEIAGVRAVVERAGEVPEPVRALPAAFAALEGRLLEGASEVAHALREEMATLVERVVGTVAAQGADERRHQEAESHRVVEAVRAEMSTLRELVERAVEVPPSLLGLPQAMAALESRLVEADQKRDVEVAQQLRAEAASLRALVERLPEAAAALDKQLMEDRRQQQADVADVAQLVRVEVEHVRALAERPIDVPPAVLGLPQSVAALQEQLVEGERRHEARHGEVIETVAAQLREQLREELGVERELQRAHVESLAAAAGTWFVQARDLILERVDKVAAGPPAPPARGSVDVPSSGAVDDLLAEVRALRGELEAIDAGLGALSHAVKSLMDDGRAAGAAPRREATVSRAAAPRRPHRAG